MTSEYSVSFGQDSALYVQILVYMLVKCVILWISTSVVLTYATTTTERTAAEGGHDQRIYVHGGRPVRPGEFPYLALLVVATAEGYGYGELAICSGTIPSPSTVLTSAHCDVGDITAYAGVASNNETELRSSNVQVRYVVSVTKPRLPRFYDIMICYVNQSWVWNEFVGPVALHLSEMSLQPSFVISCEVLGFGRTSPDGEIGVAHAMKQLIGSSSQCMHLHPFMWFFSFWMCSVDIKNKTMCGGDSGGPAMCSTDSGDRQWAVNMGVAPADEDCVPFKTANVYVATAYFRNWILSNIEDLPSSAGSVQRSSVKILMYQTLLYQLLGLLLPLKVELLYLH